MKQSHKSRDSDGNSSGGSNSSIFLSISNDTNSIFFTSISRANAANKEALSSGRVKGRPGQPKESRTILRSFETSTAGER